MVDTKKGVPLVRNKSSIDTRAALKAKTSVAVTSRYLQPKKTVDANAATKKVSPLQAKKTSGVGTAKATAAKRSPMAGWK